MVSFETIQITGENKLYLSDSPVVMDKMVNFLL